MYCNDICIAELFTHSHCSTVSPCPYFPVVMVKIYVAALDFKFAQYDYCGNIVCTSIKIIKNEVGCRDDTVPKTVDTRRHCKEE